jgi:NarL family two-component system sensor histidine kinase LiaS
MSRFLLPFRRLQWQLTLFYIMITLIAALTVAIAIGAAGALPQPKEIIATPAQTLTNSMSFTQAPQIASYLQNQPPDQHALAVWAATWLHGFAYNKLGFRPYPASTAGAVPQLRPGDDGAHNVTVVIVGSNGQPVASAAPTGPSLSSDMASPLVQTAIHNALTQDSKQESFSQTSTLADGRTVACVPVLADGHGPPVGALLIIATIVAGPPTSAATYSLNQFVANINGVLPIMLAVVLLASVVGTLFGVIASRGITHRLRAITLAADAWSRGEFQATVRDTRHDELGMLAADLNTMAEQLQSLVATRQELAVVEERHRLARDLHDSVKQQTFVMRMLMGTARNLVAGNDDAERVLSEAEQLVGQTQRELTAIIRTLRPTARADMRLSTALQALCGEWSQRTGILVRCELADNLPLAPDTEQELLRVAQEALANVARHSHATSVAVRICVERDGALLTIQDDGRGFDPERLSGEGLGLSSMRERVEALGGSLQIISGHEGTSVQAYIPIGVQPTPSARQTLTPDCTSGGGA